MLKYNFRQECLEYGLHLDEWKIYYFDSTNKEFIDKYGHFYMIKKKLSDNNLPILVGLPGFSVKSFCGSTNRIIENLSKIENKFKEIYILCFTTKVKEIQKKVCEDRDKLKDTDKDIYKSEVKLNDNLGTIVDKLLRSIKLTNVHLLGKCAGGGVAIHTFTKSDIYDALYLGVPGSPMDVQHLLTKQYIDKKFVFVWNKRDVYVFPYGISNQEIIKYSETMKQIKNNIIIIEEVYEDESTEPFHEIPHKLFDLI